jgi:hypothetical protein
MAFRDSHRASWILLTTVEKSRMIEYAKYYSREIIQANPRKIYVFGDNMERRGLGGQARAARGEPNTIGIPTKWKPASTPDAFFRDQDVSFVRPVIAGEFRKLYWYLREGYTVVWPSNGIGTGRARLRDTAPRIARYLEECFDLLARGDYVK